MTYGDWQERRSGGANSILLAFTGSLTEHMRFAGLDPFKGIINPMLSHIPEVTAEVEEMFATAPKRMKAVSYLHLQRSCTQ